MASKLRKNLPAIYGYVSVLVRGDRVPQTHVRRHCETPFADF